MQLNDPLKTQLEQATQYWRACQRNVYQTDSLYNGWQLLTYFWYWDPPLGAVLPKRCQKATLWNLQTGCTGMPKTLYRSPWKAYTLEQFLRVMDRIIKHYPHDWMKRMQKIARNRALFETELTLLEISE